MHTQGFSLLELLIIIGISSIVATVGIHHWKAIVLRNELVSTTQQLAYFLNEVQVKAYTENQNYKLFVFSSPWCLTITSEERPASCKQGELHFIKPNNSVEITGLTEKKLIYFWGRRNMAQSFSLELSNEVGKSKVFVSYRGRIRFCQLNSYLPSLPPC